MQSILNIFDQLVGTWQYGGLFEMGLTPEFTNNPNQYTPDGFELLEPIDYENIIGQPPPNRIAYYSEVIQYWHVAGENLFPENTFYGVGYVRRSRTPNL
jgi:hypothetical protein